MAAWRSTLAESMMKTTDEHTDYDLDIGLKCDFPVRESFKEALLERLKTQDAQDAPYEPPRAVLLSDDDLGLLSAAGDPSASASFAPDGSLAE